jgi:penicillin-binding protein 1B
VAAVGDRQPRFAGFNRAMLARRPVGSVIKPFVFLTALAQGDRFNLASPLQDQPLVVALEGGREWRPRNYDGISHGAVMMIDALVHSYNQATTWLGMELGLATVIDTLVDLGLNRRPANNPSLLLGAVELAPTEVAQLYVSLANGGHSTPLNAVLSVSRADGQPLLRANTGNDNQGDSHSSWLIQYALQRAVDEGTGRTLSALLGHNAPVAGKTGTSNGLRDSWFAGFSDDLVAVVWVGRDDDKPAGVSGAGGALKVFGELFGNIPWRPLESSPPPGVSYQWVAAGTGLLAEENCQGAQRLPFAESSAPTEWDECAGNRSRRWRFWPFGD